MKLLLLTLSLTERPPQFELFGEGIPTERKGFLDYAFKRQWKWESRGNEFTYKFFHTSGDYIIGAAGRPLREQHYSGPEDNYEPENIEFWERSMFILNTQEHQQVIAMEENSKVGTASALIKGLVEEININDAHPFKVDAWKKTRREGFFEAVRSYPRPITSVEFSYVVPNPIGSSDSIKKALQRYKDKSRAKNVETKISNPDGLDIESEDIRESVDYVSEGRGKVKAKSNARIVFDSDNDEKTIEADELVKDDLSQGILDDFLKEEMKDEEQ